MLDVWRWMEDLRERLLAGFGGRLLFVGLQGSRRRGEATPESDIDAVVILDTLGIGDLAAYRAIVQSMPEPRLACGFVGGRAQMANWPRHELFQFYRDTVALHGELAPLLPPVGDADIRDGIVTGASGIYHAACHLYIHGDEAGRHADLAQVYKGCFFILLAIEYLRTGVYAATRRELLERLDGDERDILAAAMDWGGTTAGRADDPDRYFDLVLRWSGRLVADGAVR